MQIKLNLNKASSIFLSCTSELQGPKSQSGDGKRVSQEMVKEDSDEGEGVKV